MTYALYIAAAAVIGLLIGFVALSISWMRKTVMRNIRSKTIGLLSVYDELLEKKSRELKAAERAKQDLYEEPDMYMTSLDSGSFQEAAASPSTILGMAERAGIAAYRDGNLGSVYRRIRQNFSFRLEELIPELASASGKVGGPAGRLLAELDWDTVYHLSTLPSESQVQVLREVLDGESAEVLERYLELGKRFSALEFYDHLKACADMEPKNVCLRVSPDCVENRLHFAGVDIIPDDEICEGFQAEVNHLLYDYSIKARELR